MSEVKSEPGGTPLPDPRDPASSHVRPSSDAETGLPTGVTLPLSPNQHLSPNLPHSPNRESGAPLTYEDRTSLETVASEPAHSPSDPAPPSASLDETRLPYESEGRYDQQGILGRGGIGQVNLVLDRHLRRDVALKELRTEVLHADLSQRRRLAIEARFVNEARVTAQLQHPGVVPIYELGRRPDGSLYYTMQVVRGHSLGEALAGDLAARLALLPRLVALCNAVAFAHDHGVIHRDLKPDNVMLGDYGETILLDWGLAKAKGARDLQASALASEIDRLKHATATETVAGIPIGTPAYMPPEQASGQLERIDERSDVYALGAILYQLLTGQPPFVGASALEVVKRVIHDPVEPPEQLEPAAPPELAAVAMRALSKDPEARYRDAKQLAADVSAFLTGGLVRAHRYTPSELLGRWVRRHRGMVLVLLAVVAVGVGAAWYGWRAKQAEEEARRDAYRRDLLAQVDTILERVRRSEKSMGTVATLAYKLTSLKHPLVEQRLIHALEDDSAEVRRLAARALGGMGSTGAVDALIARLAPGKETSQLAVIDVVNSLGVIGDPRAEEPIREARLHFGLNGEVWRKTAAAYRMIPLENLKDGGHALSARDWFNRGRALAHKATGPDGHSKAIAALDRAIELDPRHLDALRVRGAEHKAMGAYTKALADYGLALKVAPGNPEVLNNRALLRLELEQYDGAIEDLNLVVKAGSLRDLGYRNRARVLIELGRFTDALEDLEHAIELAPRHPANYGTLGDVWFQQNQWPEAQEAFTRSIELDDDDTFPLLRRAEIAWAKEDMAAADADVERALDRAPDNRWALRARATLRYSQGKADAALTDLQSALTHAPGSPWSHVGMAAVWYAQRGEFESALQSMERAVAGETSPFELPGWQLMRAWIAFRGGNRSLVQALVAPTRTKPGRTWHATVLQVLRGKVTPTDAESRIRRQEDRCELQTIAGLEAELRGDTKDAAAHYAQAAEAKRFFNPWCILAGVGRKLLGPPPQAPQAPSPTLPPQSPATSATPEAAPPTKPPPTP